MRSNGSCTSILNLLLILRTSLSQSARGWQSCVLRSFEPSSRDVSSFSLKAFIPLKPSICASVQSGSQQQFGSHLPGVRSHVQRQLNTSQVSSLAPVARQVQPRGSIGG